MNFQKVLVSLTFSLLVQQVEATKLVKIINNSPETAFFKSTVKSFALKPGATQHLLVAIPFTPRQKKLVDFILDRPYVPEDALEIVTVEGTFYIWLDERGVIAAKQFERGMSREEALPNVYLSLTSQDLTRVIGCIVAISDTGFLSIKKS